MTGFAVQSAPALSRVADVELMHTGTWSTSTGEFTFTSGDFVAAVAALDCPAVRRPVLKLGHTDPRFDGQPAVGYIGNLRSADNARTLVGDYEGMPGWLGTQDENGGSVLASAFPDRSIEGEYNFRCSMGHLHPFVITAVALLGEAEPAIGSLESLQDVGKLYGVTAVPVEVAASSTQAETRHGGQRVRFKATAQEAPMPTPRTVSASATDEDLRRAFYDSPIGNDWNAWIEAVNLAPLEIIYVNDADGSRFRVPVTIGAGDGVDAITFGDPARVVLRYEDAGAVNASLGEVGVIRYATRALSRPGSPPTQTPAATAGGSTATQERGVPVFSNEQLTTMRQSLGLADDADEATIVAAMSEALAEAAETPAPTTPPAPAPIVVGLPDGTVAVDEAAYQELVSAARRGATAYERQEEARRETLVDAAWRSGRIPFARAGHWREQLAADPGAEAVLASLAPGLVPVEATGTLGDAPATAADDSWFPQYAGTRTTQEG